MTIRAITTPIKNANIVLRSTNFIQKNIPKQKPNKLNNGNIFFFNVCIHIKSSNCERYILRTLNLGY